MAKYFVSYSVTSPGGIHDHTRIGNTVVEQPRFNDLDDFRQLEEKILKSATLDRGDVVKIVSFHRLD
jgi:hypothetical protein